jgi:hypothetical protein
VGRGPTALPGLASPPGPGTAGDGGPLASPRLEARLAPEVPPPPRPAAAQCRGARADRRYVARQPPLGHRAHPRRTLEARDHREQSLDPPLSRP